MMQAKRKKKSPAFISGLSSHVLSLYMPNARESMTTDET
jgi:hypothetical protein